MQSFEPLTMGRSARVGQSVSTSPTSSSSSNAASRQKSCNACVRGKRRCDKTTPRCTRCAAKGLECVYQRVPPGSSPSSVTLAQSSNRLSEAAAAAGMGYNKPVSADMTDDDFEMSGFDVADLASAGYGHHHHHHHESGHRMGGAGGSSTATTSPELVLDPSLEFSIADLLGSTSSAGSSTGIGTTTPDDSTASMHAFWNLPSFNEPKADFPTLAQPFPFQEQPPPAQQQQQQQQQEDQHQHQHQQQQVIRDVAILNELRSASKCFAVDPLLVHDPRSSIGYMFDTLTKLYVGFVATRALPFAHPRLYSVNVPKTVMAAYCGAAAYASRSPETRAWAIKAVQNAAAEVHAEGARASTDLEKLARCHALLVLDSIRIFDGDLGLRYAAEREMGTLREWSMELVGIVREFEGDAAAKAGREQQPPATWDTWIFEESARRTATVALAFQCFYSIMRSETPDPELMGRNMPYTASRHLWNAASSVEFFRAWREQPQWTIQNFDFKEFWQYARAEDLDDFTRMMLTVQSSPDAVEHFLQGDTTIPVRNTGSCTGA